MGILIGRRSGPLTQPEVENSGLHQSPVDLRCLLAGPAHEVRTSARTLMTLHVVIEPAVLFHFAPCLHQEEWRLDVEVHHLVPAAFGEILEQWASGGPGIVEQNVEPGFMFDELRRERPAVFHR
jgi:hypothetical protein